MVEFVGFGGVWRWQPQQLVFLFYHHHHHHHHHEYFVLLTVSMECALRSTAGITAQYILYSFQLVQGLSRVGVGVSDLASSTRPSRRPAIHIDIEGLVPCSALEEVSGRWAFCCSAVLDLSFVQLLYCTQAYLSCTLDRQYCMQ
jgi:hypothetical protein